MDSLVAFLLFIEFVFIFLVWISTDNYDDYRLRETIKNNESRIIELESRIKKLEDKNIVTEINSIL